MPSAHEAGIAAQDSWEQPAAGNYTGEDLPAWMQSHLDDESDPVPSPAAKAEGKSAGHGGVFGGIMDLFGGLF